MHDDLYESEPKDDPECSVRGRPVPMDECERSDRQRDGKAIPHEVGGKFWPCRSQCLLGCVRVPRLAMAASRHCGQGRKQHRRAGDLQQPACRERLQRGHRITPWR